jgi:L-fucose isomerase-like protein
MMETNKKSTFVLFFGNRGFFPASLQAQARKEMPEILKKLGHKTLAMEADATNHGAVETMQEGQIYANFLRKHQGEFDGVILCLPNFGDETGAVAALEKANVPILIQAYPDDLDKMAPTLRRDAFCGKFSIMDVFYQYGLKFTTLAPHTVNPNSNDFAEQIRYFDSVCQVVKKISNFTVGAIGARTTAFKTVRIDELTLQRNGITVETHDLSDVFSQIRSTELSTDKAKEKANRLKNYTRWKGVPEAAFDNMVRLGVVLDDMIEEMQFDAIAFRCWVEIQKEFGISPCTLISEINDRCIAASCEVDIGSAITMHALSAASKTVSTCLDWNNNYGDEKEKCILFHCGPVPQTMMTEKGRVVDHAILENVVGKNQSYGCNVGRIAPTPMTFGNLITDEGKMKFYLGQGRITEDEIPENFFGCSGVAEIKDLQQVFLTIGSQGHRHHVAVTPGHHFDPIHEALDKYLGFDVTTV